MKNPGYVVLGLGHAKGVCVTQHLTPCWIMVAGHIRLGGQDLPQHANCTFSTLPFAGMTKPDGFVLNGRNASESGFNLLPYSIINDHS